MTGAYIASMVVTVIQYLRLRDRRLLALLALFAFQALALTRDWWDYKKEVFQTASCAAGLVLLLVLTMRRPAPAEPASPDVPPRPPAA